MIYQIYYQFVKDNWKLYSFLLLTLVSLPMQRIAMPHYYGKIIDTLKSGKMDEEIKTNGHAVAALILSLMFILVIPIIISFILAIAALAKIKQSPSLYTKKSKAIAIAALVIDLILLLIILSFLVSSFIIGLAIIGVLILIINGFKRKVIE